MINTRTGIVSILAVCAFTGTSAIADLMWDEAIDGDLSGDYANPTQLFTKGVNNHVRFITEDLSGDPDREYFTFTIDAGYELTNLFLDTFETTPEFNLAFIAIASGSAFPTPPSAPDPGAMLGYALVGIPDAGTDILQLMGEGAGSQGFTGPLGAGSYSIWAQETSIAIDVWDLNFVVTAIPAPGALSLLGLGAIGLRRRRA